MGGSVRACSSLECCSAVLPADPPPGKEERDSVSMTIEDLSNDVLGMIFLYAANGGKELQTMCRLRNVSSRWYQVLDLEVIGRLWGEMRRETGHPELRDLHEILAVRVCYHPKFRSLEEGEPTYFSRFAALTDTLRNHGASIPEHGTVLGFDARRYEQMQREIDLSREAAWPSILRCRDRFGAAMVLASREQINQRFSQISLEERFNQPQSLVRIPDDIHLPARVYPCNGLMISRWFHHPLNAEAMTLISQLDLQGVQLKGLLPEIGGLINLTDLNLYRNELTSLPRAIGDLTKLTDLNLCYNRFSSFPRAIGDLINLTDLNFRCNQLASLPSAIGNLTRLSTLDLSWNQLKVLPSAMGKLTNLVELFVTDNELKRFPPFICRFTKLTTLYLSQNQLAALPGAIGDLTRLEWLGLEGNWLKSLPNAIGNLTQLEGLFIDQNQLTSLPKEMTNLVELGELYLGGNPLIFVLDHHFQESQDPEGRPYVYAEQSHQKYLACASYRCRTPVALLCQEIHLGKEVPALEQAFDRLPDEMKQRICGNWEEIPSSLGGFEAEQNLFADRARFVKAVIGAIKERFDRLAEGQRLQVGWHVWDLAGRPEREDGGYWDKKLAEDNIIRLVDAMELYRNELLALESISV